MLLRTPCSTLLFFLLSFPKRLVTVLALFPHSVSLGPLVEARHSGSQPSWAFPTGGWERRDGDRWPLGSCPSQTTSHSVMVIQKHRGTHSGIQRHSILILQGSKHNCFRIAFACCGKPLGFLSVCLVSLFTEPQTLVCLVYFFPLNHSFPCLWIWVTPSHQLAPESDGPSSRKPSLISNLGAPSGCAHTQLCMSPSYPRARWLGKGRTVSSLLGLAELHVNEDSVIGLHDLQRPPHSGCSERSR